MANENTKIIDKLVAAYNNSDARAFADLFAENIVTFEHPNQVAQSGREMIFEFYQKVFAEFPQNRTEVLHRIVIGNRVLDHERVRRSPEAEPFECLAIYELKNGLIERFDIVR